MLSRAQRTLLLLLVGSVACGGDSETAVSPPASGPTVAGITLDHATANLARGQALEIKTTLRNAAGSEVAAQSLSWSVVDPSIVTVEASGTTGKLVAGRAGTTTVTASLQGVSTSASITVIGFSSITAGHAFSCATSTSGQLYCAGAPYGADAVPVAPTTRFSSLSIGGLPSADLVVACGIDTDQRALCWGANESGQLGTGDLTARSTPTPVAGTIRFSKVSAGFSHACGISTDGDAYCWGAGSEGRLGDGGVTNRNTPVKVALPSGTKVTQIDAGNFTTCAVTVSAQAWCWGRNDLGQLGSTKVPGGSIGDFSTEPVLVENSAGTQMIVTKGPKSCLLNSAGSAFCFGDNTTLLLGVPATTQQCYGQKPCSALPVAVQGGRVFTNIAASQFATCGLTASRETFCWGMDFENLFGAAPGTVPACAIQGAFPCSAEPVAGPTRMVTLTSSRTNHCGMRDDGFAWCWGGNANGQRGWGASVPDPAPRVFRIASR